MFAWDEKIGIFATPQERKAWDCSLKGAKKKKLKLVFGNTKRISTFALPIAMIGKH
jgi:hypothetical protein